MKRFYDIPTAVFYWDCDEKRYVNGVAYRDEIICLCCGGIIEIPELIELAAEDKIYAPILHCKNWKEILIDN